MSYKPPYTITNEMINRISSISVKLGELDGASLFESRPKLRRDCRIKSVHASLAIEQNGLSLDEVRGVINGREVIGPENEILEVKNAIRAYDELENLDYLSISDLKKVHSVLSEGLIETPGEYRTGNEGVFNGETCIFIAPPPELVDGHMQDLFEWMKENPDVHPLIMSSVFHYEFVFIHPFTDGNGRAARLWQTLILSSWNKAFKYIPIESEIKECQQDYYDAISRSHVEGTSDSFVEFMLDMIERAVDRTISESKKSLKKESEYVKKLMFVMEEGIPYTANQVMEQLGLKSKETLRANYINPAIEGGYIQMELPDKPTSRNQRYIAVNKE